MYFPVKIRASSNYVCIESVNVIIVNHISCEFHSVHWICCIYAENRRRNFKKRKFSIASTWFPFTRKTNLSRKWAGVQNENASNVIFQTIPPTHAHTHWRQKQTEWVEDMVLKLQITLRFIDWNCLCVRVVVFAA